MAKFDTQLTGKIGEHLVTAELARRGIFATPFSGNVPALDILAYANRISAAIQVKTMRQGAWQFDITKFLDIKITPTRQKLLGINTNLDRNMYCVLVALGDKLGEDRFYVIRMGWLQDYFLKTFKPRRLPQKVDSKHCAIWEKDVKRHLDKWGLIEKKFNQR
jgi:hypothetical protein